MPEEKLYIGTKIITACPMNEDMFLKIYKRERPYRLRMQ